MRAADRQKRKPLESAKPRTGNTQRILNGFKKWRIPVKRRSAATVSSPFAESMMNVVSMNHNGTAGRATTNNRMGSGRGQEPPPLGDSAGAHSKPNQETKRVRRTHD
jgi:hypothetical protein